jgi:hypothetical protein
MTIFPYLKKIDKTNITDKTDYLYFRIKLSNSDLEYIKTKENLFYQLKCIGATNLIFDIKNKFKISNFEFYDRIRPNIDFSITKKSIPFIPFSNKKRRKAEFGIMLINNLKKSLVIVLKIEFYEDNIRFLDINILNRWGTVIDKFIDKRNEYLLALELEKIYQLLFSLPKQEDLCKTCSFYNEYQAKGYCIKYHPDSRIPSDF